jgi:hypothetical protein
VGLASCTDRTNQPNERRHKEDLQRGAELLLVLVPLIVLEVLMLLSECLLAAGKWVTIVAAV